MRQGDVVSILRASAVPMTVAEILEAHGVHEAYKDSDYANLRIRLYQLKKFGIVRSAGFVQGDRGQRRMTWELVA